ncbi:uncharacterized membrane protein YjgN [Hoeflea halophila]|uniref:Uncharacterized membrane protein YjgN n=1 Tax=Hoeflea halophila TaxID=714899 RepID=A0A286HVZ2_9HYPH|nr:YjgN family protein [Hoeflea halophila]SOE11961.1 uncharacterized membrane protein YjgN [Hoeflea halophila]
MTGQEIARERAQEDAAGVPAETLRIAPFIFTGTASEYFRIWIVNLFLTIITIGIYSPWAKVRRLKYFYGNTWLDGHNFDYVANPKKILVGRLIVVGAIILVNVLVNISPVFAILVIPYLIAFPWIFNKSMAFNARMTVYRNVRFGFGGSYGGALKSFVLWPIAAYLTALLLSPFMFRAWNRYIGSNTRWGAAGFSTVAGVGPYYGNFGRTLLFGLLLTIALVALLLGNPGMVWSIVASALMYPLIFGLIFYHSAGVRNIAFNSTVLDGRHKLKSRLIRGRYFWIMITNFIATVLSLGLLRPWAATRTWRYLADNTALEIDGDLDLIVDAQQAEGNVAAAEYFDIEGIDFGL